MLCVSPWWFLDVYSPASGHGLVGVAFMWCLMLCACAAARGRACSAAGPIQPYDLWDHLTLVYGWGCGLKLEVDQAGLPQAMALFWVLRFEKTQWVMAVWS